MRPGMLYAVSAVLGIGTGGFIVAAAWMTAMPEPGPADAALTSVSSALLPAQDPPKAGLLVNTPLASRLPPQALGGPFVAAPAALSALQAADESGPAASDGRSQVSPLGAESPRASPREAVRLTLMTPSESGHAQGSPPTAAARRPALLRESGQRRIARHRVGNSRSAARVRIWYGTPPDIYPAPERSRPVIIVVEPRWR